MTTTSLNQLSPVVLDRDGTIMQDVGHRADPEQVEIFAGVPQALQRLNNVGFKIVVITNQSGIGVRLFRRGGLPRGRAGGRAGIGHDLIDASLFPSGRAGHRIKAPQTCAGHGLEAQRDHGSDLSARRGRQSDR